MKAQKRGAPQRTAPRPGTGMSTPTYGGRPHGTGRLNLTLHSNPILLHVPVQPLHVPRRPHLKRPLPVPDSLSTHVSHDIPGPHFLLLVESRFYLRWASSKSSSSMLLDSSATSQKSVSVIRRLPQGACLGYLGPTSPSVANWTSFLLGGHRHATPDHRSRGDV